MPAGRAERQRDRPGVGPSVFPPGPSPEHPTIPVGRGWRVAGSVIAVIVAATVVTIISIVTEEPDVQPDYQAIPTSAIETDAVDPPRVVAVEVHVDPALPGEGRVRVAGDELVRVDVAGAALCTPVSGAAGAWIDVRFCGPLDRLDITASDADATTTTAVARFRRAGAQS